jgi:hypothetical protein
MLEIVVGGLIEPPSAKIRYTFCTEDAGETGLGFPPLRRLKLRVRYASAVLNRIQLLRRGFRRFKLLRGASLFYAEGKTTRDHAVLNCGDV